MKNLRAVATAMVVATSMCASTAVYAAPTAIHSPIHAMFSNSKPKMVSFNLRNATSESIKVKAGDTEMTLKPGSTTAIKLPAGTKIVTQEATAKYEAGSVLAVVIPDLSDATVTLN